MYENVYKRRIQAKKAGDKATANSLKLILNTTYGATLNQYNDLYDPVMARSVCISGQLYLLELAEHLLKDIPDLRVVELNTDGIMAEFDDEHYEAVNAIIQEWQDRTHFGLEEEAVSRYYAKDVNNYCEIIDGEVKIKGGYLVRGIAKAGAFNVNNNAIIVADAIREYFVNGTPPENTVNACDDVFKFQMIAKAGAKYREAYHLVDGERQPVQKVNRVYATTDTRYGKLYKVKAIDDSEAKIDSLPEHCIIDNSAVTDPGHTKIDQIDRVFYIELARKRINDFLGIKPEKPKKERKTKMPRTAAPKEAAPAEPTTVLQKLLLARMKFLGAGIKKSGMNSDIEFEYFELRDIIPVATPIFAEVGLLPVVYFDKEMAYMDLVDTGNREEKITFSIPLAQWAGNRAVNPIQVIGATVTYYRRYLYQIALDICEADETDNKPMEALVETPAPKTPATPQERAETKEELTNADGQADSLLLTQLRKTCKNLKDAAKGTDQEKDTEEWLAQIAIRTKGFKEITKAQCTAIISQAVSRMEALKNG